MELTADGSYSMWNSLSKLENEWNLQRERSIKMPQFRGLLFWSGGFSRGVPHFYGSSLAMTFDFSGVSKTKLTSVEYLKRHFINHHACFFFLEQTTDRQIDLLF